MKRAETWSTAKPISEYDGPTASGGNISQPKEASGGKRLRAYRTQKGRSSPVSSFVEPNRPQVAHEDLVRPAIAETCANDSESQDLTHRRPRASGVRFAVDPRDLPLEKVARRLHLTPVQFRALDSELKLRGFPTPDPSTGMYDSVAVERWMDARSALTGATRDDTKTDARDARSVFAERVRRLSGAS